MSWVGLFQAANLLALVAWALLILGPRGALAASLVLYGGVGLLCLTYVSGLTLLVGVGPDPGGAAAMGGTDFTTIAGVRAIFATDAGVAIGWVHYLAFDLFAGLWIARDADAKGFSRLVQAPILLLTFLAGPAGLLVWLGLRGRDFGRRAGSGGKA